MDYKIYEMYKNINEQTLQTLQEFYFYTDLILISTNTITILIGQNRFYSAIQ